ncbi:hypothetical protein B0A54_02500, partial [Friedmanniomyces endolithicus]
MARGGPSKHSLAANEFDAPAIDKAKRHKKPKTADSSSKSTNSAESTSSGDAHGHLPDREVSVIERWNDEIPMKTSPAIMASDDQETAVQAYLRAKALLLEKDADDHVVGGGGSLTSEHFGADDIGWQALGPAIACVAASTCVVALRWYTRCRIVRCLGWDDYVILLSLLLAWAMLALIATAVHLGIGVAHISPMETATLTKLVIANNDLWALL